MFNPSREQVRQFFCDAWKKHHERMPLLGAEATAVDLILRHPEYHALLADPERALAAEWTPEGGEMNPFLHLSLHLAIHEQVSIDQPPGIRAAFLALSEKTERHAAEHILLDKLGEIIWQAQNRGTTLDAHAYVEEIRRLAGLR